MLPSWNLTLLIIVKNIKWEEFEIAKSTLKSQKLVI